MKQKEMRAAFVEALIDKAKDDDRVMIVDADLGKAGATGQFASVYPERKINVGVAEANMVGVAAGLASVGKVPFAQTFGCFAARRVFDQFFISAAYAKLGVKLVGTDPGVAAAFNGGTHMPFEDIGLMRNVPNLPIIEPSDPISCQELTKKAVDYPGPMYIRLHRKPLNVLYSSNEKFEIGKSKVLKDGGSGATVILSLGGILVNEALKAAEILTEKKVPVIVIDVLSVKPLDEELILEKARNASMVITCENHQTATGLCSAVSELFVKNRVSVPFSSIGIKDEFGQVGTENWLKEYYKLTAKDIVAVINGEEK
jgi:transketolase